MATTTELIKLLKDVEYSASGRPREIKLYLEDENDSRYFMEDLSVKICGGGDGCVGGYLSLNIKNKQIWDASI